MKPVRLAALAALLVAVVAAVAWMAGPVDVAEPRFSIEMDVGSIEPPESDEDEPECEQAGPGCAEQPSPVSDALSVGTLMFSLAFLAGMVRLVIKLIRKILSWNLDVRLPIPMDETVDAHIREALREASEQAARDVEGVPSGEATDAVVACWVRLERTAERVGTPRAAVATPTEFTVELLRAHNADPRAVATLLDLYEQARFGTSALPETASGTAAEALRTIAAGLSGAAAPAEDAS